MVTAGFLPTSMQRYMVHVPRVLCFVITILIAITAAQLAWSLFSPPQIITQQTSQPKKAKLVAPPPPRPEYGNQIARLRLMGKPEVLASPIATQDAPDTSLNLALSGVVAFGGGDGFAIIADQTKKHKYYQIDDEITSGVTLAAVYPEYVLLNRAGRNEKLRLPKADTLINQPTPVSRAPATLRRNVQPNQARNPSQNQRSTTSQTQTNAITTASALRTQLKTNPSVLKDYFVIAPENDPSTGTFKGFRLNPNQASSELFYDLGLNDDDVVVSINDITLDNPNKGAKVFKKILKAKELDITVLRDGTEITLFHSLE